MKRALAALVVVLTESRRHYAYVIFVMAAIWLAATAGLRPLLLPDEGRYAGVAWEMLTSDNWLVPTLSGLPFFHKPPLFYWLTALSMTVFGENDWAARLASILAATAAVTGLYLFLRRHAVEQRLAGLSAGVLLTQPLFFGGAQFANLDMLVGAMISLTIILAAHAVLCLERGLPYRTALGTAYAFAALGILAKGLIGVLLPGAVIFIWLVVRGQVRRLPALLPLHLIALLLLLAIPWFWRMQILYDGFVDYFFVYHHFQRFSQAGFNNPKPFWFYLPVLIVGALPWSPWIVRLFSRSLLQNREKFALRTLMLVWLLVILVFFSVPSSKLVGYILPAFPPFACLLADAILDWLDQRPRTHATAAVGANLVAAVALCLLLVLIAAQRGASLRGLLTAAAVPFAEDDQIVMLDEYQYDLPFYLKAKKNPWVVSDWAREDLLTKDNWRRELYEAARFDPAGMRERLLFPGDLTARACAESTSALWIWGKMAYLAQYPFLEDQAAIVTVGDNVLWRIGGEARQRIKGCGETPRSG